MRAFSGAAGGAVDNLAYAIVDVGHFRLGHEGALPAHPVHQMPGNVPELGGIVLMDI